MKLQHLRYVSRHLSDETVVVGFVYDIDAGNEYIDEKNEGMEPDNEDFTPLLTQEEWLQIAERFEKDKHFWQFINDSFDYCVERVIEARKG